MYYTATQTVNYTDVYNKLKPKPKYHHETNKQKKHTIFILQHNARHISRLACSLTEIQV